MSHKEQVAAAAEILRDPSARIHLVGAGGSGMAGVARLLLDAGYNVTGSDQRQNEVVDSLRARRMAVYQGHHRDHLGGADALVYSTAVGPDNPERREAAGRGVPEFRRAEFLSALLAERRVIVVAGTHGKTTTTMMMARILIDAGLDPSYYIGAEVPTFGTSAALGQGDLAVVEADESDGTFLAFRPAHAIVLNIDRDHLDFYRSDDDILAAFERLCAAVDGSRVLCADDAGCRQLADRIGAVEWFGFDETAALRLRSAAPASGGTDFTLEPSPGAPVLAGRLSLPGRHNLSNALAALTLARHLGVDLESACRSLGTLSGASRRFEILYRQEGGWVVDDYAHHPVEIRATLATARSVFDGPIIAVFQPHRYSRTTALMDEFAAAFRDVDAVVVTRVYGAGEEDPGTDPARELAGKMAAAGIRATYEPDWNLLPARAMEAHRLGAMLLTLGAGNIGNLAHALKDDFTLADRFREVLSPDSRVRLYEPMRKHTTLRVGGPARLWIEPATAEDAATALRECARAGRAWMAVGKGSNLLVRDAGISEVCLHLASPVFQEIRIEGTTIHAGGGARLKEISYAAMRAGIAGFEFMEGIPASLGGALRMNAGAMQSWMFEVVQSVRLATPDGEIRDVARGDIEARYRHVPLLESNLALGAVMQGTADSPDAIKERMNLYSKKRWASQPAAPSAGCTFKNPSGDAAGRLIDELGLKEKKIGGARISSVHANFIVNDGEATAEDVLGLINLVRKTVLEKKGIELEPEVVVVGDA